MNQLIKSEKLIHDFQLEKIKLNSNKMLISICYLFCEFTMNSFFFHEFSINYISRINYEFFWCFTKTFRVSYLFRECNINLLLFRVLTLNSLSFLRIHYIVTFGLTIYLANILGLHFLLREFTLNSRSITRNFFKNTSCFANIIRIHYPIANSLWIEFLFCDYTMNW